jgi:TRAP-type mannitol/chloroaromatic compound transport system permease small subunit
MKALLAFAKTIDSVNDFFAVLAKWAVAAACFISAANAVVRYGFDWSSNAFLEVQWYLFAACVMFGAPQVLRLNEHVRVDVLYGLYPSRGKVFLDLAGLCLFLLPMALLVMVLSWPLVVDQFHSGEHSNNAGGLIRWPVTATVPFGLALLSLQALAEVIKRIGWLAHLHEMDTHYERPLQ